MSKTMILVGILLLMGCTEITQDEQIQLILECEAAGLDAKRWTAGHRVGIACYPKGQLKRYSCNEPQR